MPLPRDEVLFVDGELCTCSKFFRFVERFADGHGRLGKAAEQINQITQ
jgi:hypothetical protein